MSSSAAPPNLLPSFLSCQGIMPVAAMFISPSFDLHEAMMAPELFNPKMDPVLISKQVTSLALSKPFFAEVFSSNALPHPFHADATH